MIPTIIVYGTPEERLQKVFLEAQPTIPNIAKIKYKNHPDVFVLEDDKSLGIDLIRQLKKSIFRKPFSLLQRLIIIKTAELLTLEAQNALLKILEEPPANNLFYLLAPDPNSLLPTIISRCRLLKLEQKWQISYAKKELDQALIKLQKITKASVGKKVALINELFPDPDEAVDFLQKVLLILKKRFINSPLRSGKQLNKTLAALKLVKSNINHRLVLEDLFIHLRMGHI